MYDQVDKFLKVFTIIWIFPKKKQVEHGTQQPTCTELPRIELSVTYQTDMIKYIDFIKH